jgi:tetratricopeptide (TPR) repeat protein
MAHRAAQNLNYGTRGPSGMARIELMHRILWLTVALALIPGMAMPGFAQSAAAKNKTGNKLFEEGRYPEAEKAYRDAQARMPENPELSYNLGNSLIKQKRADPALQALRQAISKGDRTLQSNAWYNLGNAQFADNGFKDAVQSYTQSLRLNPKDRDAKNNLELALRKMEEQKQSKEQGANPQQSEDQKDRNQGKNQPEPQNRKSEPEEQKSNDLAAESEGKISKERALQILDAMKNQELADRKKQLEKQARQQSSSRDW